MKSTNKRSSRVAALKKGWPSFWYGLKMWDWDVLSVFHGFWMLKKSILATLKIFYKLPKFFYKNSSFDIFWYFFVVLACHLLDGYDQHVQASIIFPLRIDNFSSEKIQESGNRTWVSKCANRRARLVSNFDALKNWRVLNCFFPLSREKRCI